MRFKEIEIKSLSKSIFLAEKFVTCGDFVEYLNFEEHSNTAGDGSYKFYNFVNPELPIRLDGGRYICKPNCSTKAVTGISWWGAQAYAKFHGYRLITLSEWISLIQENGLSKHELQNSSEAKPLGKNNFSKIQSVSLYESFSFGISTWLQLDVEKNQCHEHLFREANKSQYVAGYGFNKTVSDTDENWLYRRWGRTGAISVGLWCVKS